MHSLYIVDDGTLDTVIEYRDRWFRYSSEYRFEFKNDDDFLHTIEPDVIEEWSALEDMCA